MNDNARTQTAVRLVHLAAMPFHHVTLVDVAKAADVSGATVSRALRDDPRISLVVRDRVKAECQRLGYSPNPLVQALMAQRRRKQGPHGECLALVTSVTERIWQSKDVCRWYWRGMVDRAEQLGYNLETFCFEDAQGGFQRLQRVLTNRGIRGLVLGFSGEEETIAPDISGFCVVGLSNYFGLLPVDRVQVHGFFNVKLAIQKMRAAGYQRIGLVAPVRNNAIVGGQWSAAALDEQWLRPAHEQCPPLLTEGTTVNTQKFHAWFRNHKPDALLVYKVRVTEPLEGLRLNVPTDVGLAYLFGTEHERSSMAGIDGCLDRVGAAAVDLLVQKMHINDRGYAEHPRDVLITGKWQMGSTMPARESAAKS